MQSSDIEYTTQQWQTRPTSQRSSVSDLSNRLESTGRRRITSLLQSNTSAEELAHGGAGGTAPMQIIEIVDLLKNISIALNIFFIVLCVGCCAWRLKSGAPGAIPQEHKDVQTDMGVTAAAPVRSGKSTKKDVNLASKQDAVHNKEPSSDKHQAVDGTLADSVASKQDDSLASKPINTDNKEPPIDKYQSALATIENLAWNELYASVKKSTSKSSGRWYKGYKDRFVACAPMGGPTSDGSVPSRLEHWHNGFLGWWENQQDFTSWCSLGRPAPKGSFSIHGIQSAHVVHEMDKVGYVLIKHDGETDQHDMYIIFEDADKATEWVQNLRRFREALGETLHDDDESVVGSNDG